MSDQINYITVVLEEDKRDDDCEATRDGISHLEFNKSDLPEMVERISGELLKSTDLFSILVAAFKAGEELGQANAKNIYRTTYPKEDVNEAAPEYATKILSENAKLNRRSDDGTN